MALTATIATCDHLLRDYYLPPLDHELKTEGIVHTCGEPYKLSFLESDGRLFRPVPAMDAYEAILTAVCEDLGCKHKETRYNYCRAAITGTMLYSLRAEDVVKAVSLHLRSAWDDLKAHLTALAPAPPKGVTINSLHAQLQKAYLPAITAQLNAPSILHDSLMFDRGGKEDAMIAEWLTKKLVEEGGELHVQQLGGLDWKPQKIIDVADEMGFVQWPHLSLPKEHPLAA